MGTIVDEKDKLLAELAEEHSDDIETIETGDDNSGSDGGGDNGTDNTEDATDGSGDSAADDSAELPGVPEPDSEEATGDDAAESTELDDSDDARTEQVGEEKNANSRIRQLLAEKKELEEKYNEKLDAERRQADLAEDPVYKLDDFLGTVDEDGEVLSDREAEARFKAWDADYKFRGLQKQQVLKEQQDTLISLQSETKSAFEKFPEFNSGSDSYDQELAEIANDHFRNGLIYAPGHDGDDNYIIGSRVNPGQLLERLHNLRAKEEVKATKVNNLSDDTGPVVSSQQVSRKTAKYAPGFRGEVDKEIDKLMGNK